MYCDVLWRRYKEKDFEIIAMIDKELVEKEVLGKINYEVKIPEGSRIFKLNRITPKLILHDAKTGETKDFWDFEEKYLIVSFFAFVCGMCKSGKGIETLKTFYKNLKNKRINYKIVLAFSEPFDREDIPKWEACVEMPFEKFISQDIFIEEEKYITDDSLKTDPLALVLNRERIVVSLENKADILEHEILKSIESFVK